MVYDQEKEKILEYKFYMDNSVQDICLIKPDVSFFNENGIESENRNKLKNPCELYDLLKKIWCAETCAPRMRSNWVPENPTYGQCSITAFLVQDIFGGKVYGILREGGNYHCYNVVENCNFDLTSEQFGEEKLSYKDNPEQLREVHFSKQEKYERYVKLKDRLIGLLRCE